MADVQKEHGHVRIANALFEAITGMDQYRIPAPVRVFLAVMRETYGFNRKTAEISTARFRKLTGIQKRQNIYRAIKEATDTNLINVIKNDYRTNPTYSIQKDYDKWSTVIKNDTGIKNDYGRNQKRLRMVSKMITPFNIKTPLKTPSKDINPTNQSRPKRKRQLPKDFELTDELIAYAKTQGINGRVQDVFDHFCDHHRAKGSTMLDWTAAWRTWCRNDKKFRGKEDRKWTDEPTRTW